MKQPVFHRKTQNLAATLLREATENQGLVLLKDDYTRSKHSWLEFSHHSDGTKTEKDGNFHGVFKLLVSRKGNG